MFPKLHSGKAVWIVATAVVLVALLLIVLFATQSAPDEKDTIVLPAAPVNPSEEAAPEEDASDLTDNDFVVITTENVPTVLRTLNRPAAYRQSYSVTVGAGEKQYTKTVEMWVNGDFLHAEVSYGQQVQSVLTDGSTLYLWYEDLPKYVTVELQSGMTAEDVLGLPDFDAYLKLQADTVTEAEYLMLEDRQVQCIYVSTELENGAAVRYWVNLDNGLLYQADALEGSEQVYSIRQTGFDMLAVEDESFSDRFVLPDGTVPFIAETRTLQPQ